MIIQSPTNMTAFKYLEYNGTWQLPIPYEGSIWDEIYGVSAPFTGYGKIVLEPDKILIRPLMMAAVAVPINRIYGLSISSEKIIGGARGKNSVLRIVWEDNGRVKCTSISFRPKSLSRHVRAINAVPFKEKMEQRIGSPKWLNTNRESDYGKQLLLIRNENRLVSKTFWFTLLVSILVSILAFTLCINILHYQIPIPGYFIPPILVPIVTGMLVYNRRYKRLGLPKPWGVPRAISFTIFVITVLILFMFCSESIFWY